MRRRMGLAVGIGAVVLLAIGLAIWIVRERRAVSGAPGLRVELGAESTPRCGCCGNLSHVLRGLVYDENGALAAYVAGYTENNPDHFGTLLISLGAWGEGTSPSQRRAVLVLVGNVEGKPSFMVGSAADCRWNDVEVMGRIMERQEALADPQIKEFWHISDHIWIADRRFSAQFE